MQAGRLRYRVTLQHLVAGSPQKNPSGTPATGWTDLAEVWAAVEPLQGREFIEANTVQSKVSVRIRIRYRAGITAAMRVLHGSTVYSIEAVINPKLKNVELQLMCSQGVNNG